MKGSDRMLIHLGKVYFGQADSLDVTSKGESTKVTLFTPDDRLKTR